VGVFARLFDERLWCCSTGGVNGGLPVRSGREWGMRLNQLRAAAPLTDWLAAGWRPVACLHVVDFGNRAADGRRDRSLDGFVRVVSLMVDYSVCWRSGLTVVESVLMCLLEL
jgi:hypothetical protein